MKLYLKTAGGIGNIRIRGGLDTDDLPPSLAEKVRRVFAPQRLDALPRVGDPGQTGDGMQYELEVTAGGETRRLLIDESVAPDDLIDTLQGLVREIVHRKKGR